MRRIPTQLMESLLAFAIGLAVLVIGLSYGPANGATFVAAFAAYTLCRQGILHLRTERRKSEIGGPLTASVAALVLIAVIVFIAGLHWALHTS